MLRKIKSYICAMIAKTTFWFQRILFLFLFTFSSVSFQQKVNNDSYNQNTISIQHTENTQQAQFQTNLSQKKNDVFSTANRRIGAGIRISGNFEQNSQKDYTPFFFKSDFYDYADFSVRNIFNRYFRFSFYESFSTYIRLYSRICCWRI